MNREDSIVAVATPPGTGGIAVIRLSGPDAIAIADKIWRGQRLSDTRANTAVYGHIYDPSDSQDLDDCIATIFRAPHSFTGEDTVEFSCHGSQWLQQAIVRLAIRMGARIATAGEYTLRAFANGKIDLAQAEGIADLISAQSKAAHRLAVAQAGGRFSKTLGSLRERLIDFASLLELELDFAEEEVEFADRNHLLVLATEIKETVDRLAATFESGSAFKEGVEVVIAGLPNAGKSTLLNGLLDDDRAIVSDIPGTTRDIIEGCREINGIMFRFVDTAGLRDSNDEIERIGIERARKRLSATSIAIWVDDVTSSEKDESETQARMLADMRHSDSSTLLFFNKTDIKPISEGHEYRNSENLKRILHPVEIIKGSAKDTDSIDQIKRKLSDIATAKHNPADELLVTNARHYESLCASSESITRAITGITSGLSADLIAQDVRETLHHLGLIIGTITTDTLLKSIFTRFCIGK